MNAQDRTAWEENMRIRIDYNNMMSLLLGDKGIEPRELDELYDRGKQALSAIREKRQNGKLDWRDLPHNQDAVIEEILSYVDGTKNDIDAFIVLGIGGSALGPMAVQQAINSPYYNELPREARGGYPKFYVADNVDPERLSFLFEAIDFKKSLFNVISKSGSTSETMSQFMIIKQMLEDALGKEEAKKHIVCTTDAENGSLIKIAKQEGYHCFVVPSGVGGRFSELCPVGLLPAAFCGINIRELLAGAAYMDKLCEQDDLKNNPAYMFAALHYIAMEKGRNITAMMPYADSLRYLADWFAQLWAESLGKKYDLEGNVVNVGQTPVRALGATDQHSQVQLYAEGPFDKMVVFLEVENYRREMTIPNSFSDVPSLGFLGNVKQSNLIQVEQASTAFALLKAQKMNMSLKVNEVNEFTLGQLIYMMEVATAFAGELMGINAFDQPGVEEGKNATYAFFGRPGYEDKKKELDNMPGKRQEFIL